MNRNISSFYYHGLRKNGEPNKGEEKLLNRQRRLGINVVEVDIDWQSTTETRGDLLERTAGQAAAKLATLNQGEILLLEGSSAGGHLAAEIHFQLNDPRVRTVLHSARVKAGDLPWWDIRNLERCAHLGTPQASQLFYDGVNHFEQITEPLLTPELRSNMLITKPRIIDELMPLDTQDIEGVQTIKLPIMGHAWSIGLGILWTPAYLQDGRI